jgi:N-acetylneuraminate synthase
MLISYAKGARTWERHIDILYPSGHEQKEVSKYCSLPNEIDQWFKAYNKAVEMCGTSLMSRRVIDQKESSYLEALYRGLYLKRNNNKGENIRLSDLYSAVPYQKELGHFSYRDFIEDEAVALRNLKKDSPLTKQDI